MEQRALHVVGQNRLISSLPDEDRSAVLADLDSISMTPRHTVAETGKPFSHVYFPLGGVISLVLDLDDGGSVEVATVGNEGMAGVPIALGEDASPCQAFCQVAGESLRMRSAQFKAHLRQRPSLQRLVLRYAHALTSQISQTAACNHAHAIEQRMSRWLLMTQDRVGTDDFSLTQEFLAMMLGVRRPSVTVVAGMLQRAGLIEYSRGKIKVLDRAGLEAASCECYAKVRRETERALAA